MTTPTQPYTDADVALIAATFTAEAKKNPIDTSTPPWMPQTRLLLGPTEHDIARAVLDALAAAGRLVPADRVADAVLVRQAAEADIARQVLILAEDPKILAMWADTCRPRPVTVTDHFRALAEKLSRPAASEVKP